MCTIFIYMSNGLGLTIGDSLDGRRVCERNWNCTTAYFCMDMYNCIHTVSHSTVYNMPTACLQTTLGYSIAIIISHFFHRNIKQGRPYIYCTVEMHSTLLASRLQYACLAKALDHVLQWVCCNWCVRGPCFKFHCLHQQIDNIDLHGNTDPSSAKWTATTIITNSKWAAQPKLGRIRSLVPSTQVQSLPQPRYSW